MKSRLKSKLTILAVLAVAIFAFSACNTSPASNDSAAETSAEAATAEPEMAEEEMTDDSMKDDSMTDDSMTEETMEETSSDDMDDTSMDEEKVFTLEELAKYNGQDGNPAYVAVDGVVYDVTDKPLWSGGQHNGNTAGQDLSEAILRSPHGKSKLADLPIVGKLAEE